MWTNYLKIALRNLRRYRGHTAINVAGLAVGLACCLLIFLFVQDEQRYDRFHDDAGRIYRVVNERLADGSATHRAATPPAMGPALVREFPEVLQAARFFNLGKTLVERDDQQFFERNVWIADSTVFDLFSFRLLQGDPQTALVAPYALVVSQSMARKYFGEADPLGQTLVLSGRNTFTITGVMEELPAQSHIAVNFLGSFATMKDFASEARLQNWIWQQFYTYILLPEGRDPAQLEAKFPAFIARYADPETSTRGFNYRTYLQPLTAVYLRSANLRFDFGMRGNVTYVYAFSIIALFILLIACFNFMNLTTARSTQRAREVGMRKVIGAQRGQLVRQFLGESVLLVMGALVLAAGLVALALPAFNTFTGKALSLDPSLVVGLVGVGLMVGLLAGSYPALFLSAFRPIEVLKGAAGRPGGGGLSAVRKGLVVTQFVISTVLIIGAAVVFRQLDYVQTKTLGFDKEQVVILPIRGDIDDNLETVKAELLRHPGIVSATASWGTPGGIVPGDDIRMPGSDNTWPTNVFTVDHDYLYTYRMELAAGRDFSRAFPADTSTAFILNETAARDLGWSLDEAVGQEIWWDEWSRDAVKKGRVIGVVKDFHYNSLHQAVGPLVMHLYPSVFGHVSVRIRPEETAATLAVLEQTWTTWAPGWPFEYYFLDEDLAAMYEAEEKAGQLAALFALLAVVIACLGLFGLSAFSAEQRTKEIGIRKVVGASAASIVLLLSKEVTRLVLAAFVVAVPVAYFAMNWWLDDFAYRVEISWGIFLMAGSLTLAIAFLTVGYQAVKAALGDPVKALRYE